MLLAVARRVRLWLGLRPLRLRRVVPPQAVLPVWRLSPLLPALLLVLRRVRLRLGLRLLRLLLRRLHRLLWIPSLWMPPKRSKSTTKPVSPTGPVL